jgi:hypothetical protein
MPVRLLHLLNEQKRKELIIFYGEELAASGFTVIRLNGEANIRTLRAQTILLLGLLGISVIAFAGENFVPVLLGGDLDFAEFAVPVLVLRIVP